MAYDLEEQESLAEIKAWWNKWGTLITTVVTVACLASAAFQGWRWYQMKQAADAGTLYAQMIQAENLKDYERVQAISKRLVDDYGATNYSAMGLLLAARSAQLNGQPAQAQSALEKLAADSHFPQYEGVAATRLAGILFDQGKNEQALKVLDAIKDTSGQEVLIQDRRGDILVDMGKVSEAKAAYQAALRASEVNNPLVQIIETKMQSLPKESVK